MPPARRPTARPAAPPAGDDGAAPLVALLDAAAEAGEVDARQLAELVGLAPGALRAALAAPARLPREQLEVVARALRVDRSVLRALARPSPGETGTTRDDAPPSDGAEPAARAIAPPAVPPDAAPARSVGELLERVLAAVADGEPWTESARLAVLDAAEQAAVAAGRGVPRELYALRHRARRGGWPAVPSSPPAAPAPGDGARPRRGELAPDDRAAVDGAARVLRLLQASGSGYADLFAPLHDDALALLLRRHTVLVREAPLGAGAPPLVTPPLYGRFVCLVDADALPDARRFATRVALAHVAAGDVGEDRPLAAPAPDGPRRAAALVALADLVPFMQLADARRARLGWQAVAEQVARQARPLVGAAAAGDLGALRVALYRATGL